jgi:SAM-dependent methyltransferase
VVSLLPHPAPPPGEAHPGWPPAVRVELTGRRARLEAETAGTRVLDLADPAARALVSVAGGDTPDPAPGDRYDVVLSVCALVTMADLPEAVRGIERLLRSGGRFLFVEPVLLPRWSGVVAASFGSRLPAARDLHLGRDVPLALRAAGFLITDLERFTMPTSVWPLRPFVDGCARPAAWLETS